MAQELRVTGGSQGAKNEADLKSTTMFFFHFHAGCPKLLNLHLIWKRLLTLGLASYSFFNI